MFRGITFAAVHDSYWTHAGTIDRMNEILRDQVICLIFKFLIVLVYKITFSAST